MKCLIIFLIYIHVFLISFYGDFNMFNKCVVANGSTGYSTGERQPSFVFPDDEELRKNRFIS